MRAIIREGGMMGEPSHEDRLFERREKAVKRGMRLPTEEDLLRGMAFFRDNLREDMREYGDRLARAASTAPGSEMPMRRRRLQGRLRISR